uniref:Integrin alpha first immunoglubulin-like domain-containing protein n=1 Tax=Oryctolagus cuniculus TaxID=9986 RepID=A0A5F9C1N5_RABIT
MCRVLVGAPKADSKYSTSVKSPGAVFKCRIHTNPDRRCTELDMARARNRGAPCGKTCREDRDDEWMGVSLARQPKADGHVLACAHRWKNIYYETDHILPHGFCYIIPSNLQAKGRTLIPCYEEYKKKYGEEHGSCQAGIAGFCTEELVVMGAPGSFYWAGTVKVLNLTDNTYFKLNDDVIMSRRYTYLGYAVTAGHFSHPSTTDVVGGAPQDEGVGKVYIFRADRRSGTLTKVFQASGKKMGSYFGSSLCAVDLNGDGLSDLLVGAPMFSEIRDEGQVTVYINRGNGALEEQLALAGDGAYNAHFGESIASLGDLDDDGFPDVAIGAPKEDDFAGAVYIYHGDAGGVVPRYSMKLSGRKINPVLRMFGQAISGGVDMDGNGYPDVTVGAFMSDSVVLLRARPVITVDVAIFLPGSINITAPQCHDGQQPVNCLNVTTCFRFHGKHVPGEIGKEPRSGPRASACVGFWGCRRRLGVSDAPFAVHPGCLQVEVPPLLLGRTGAHVEPGAWPYVQCGQMGRAGVGIRQMPGCRRPRVVVGGGCRFPRHWFAEKGGCFGGSENRNEAGVCALMVVVFPPFLQPGRVAWRAQLQSRGRSSPW